MVIKNIRPEDMKPHDQLGPYLNFLHYEEGKGYLFYQTCGLQQVYLHWQTVNWLIKTVGVTRNKGEN